MEILCFEILQFDKLAYYYIHTLSTMASEALPSLSGVTHFKEVHEYDELHMIQMLLVPGRVDTKISKAKAN